MFHDYRFISRDGEELDWFDVACALCHAAFPDPDPERHAVELWALGVCITASGMKPYEIAAAEDVPEPLQCMARYLVEERISTESWGSDGGVILSTTSPSDEPDFLSTLESLVDFS